jgi:hypothetical protein
MSTGQTTVSQKLWLNEEHGQRSSQKFGGQGKKVTKLFPPISRNASSFLSSSSLSVQSTQKKTENSLMQEK